MVCFHITTYESREVRGITLQNIWDKTYKHWQILIKTAGIFLWSGPATADRVNNASICEIFWCWSVILILPKT